MNDYSEAATSAPPTFVTRFQSVSLYEGDSVKLYCKANAENVRNNNDMCRRLFVLRTHSSDKQGKDYAK